MRDRGRAVGRLVISAMCAVVTGVLLVACGVQDASRPPRITAERPPTTTAPSPGSSSPAVSSSTSTSTTISSTDTAILAAYGAEWSAFEQAETDANPLDPMLKATMVNPLLHQVESYLVTDNQEGIVGRGPITFDPHVAFATTTSATVLDCTYSKAYLYYKKSGKEVPPITGPEHIGVKAMLVLGGSAWKVKNQVLTEGSCPAGY